ncbi:aro3 [Heliothis virescens ascovirus 3i]|nr:aro3 [Heliothis virescens ascovirus 3i]
MTLSTTSESTNNKLTICEVLQTAAQNDDTFSVADVLTMPVDSLVRVVASCDHTDSEMAQLFTLTPREKLLKRILYSGVWGALDGAATGALVGPSLMVSGGWLIGSLGDLFGFVVGLCYGSATGAVLGLLSADWQTVARNIWTYRNTTSSSYVSPASVEAMEQRTFEVSTT